MYIFLSALSHTENQKGSGCEKNTCLQHIQDVCDHRIQPILFKDSATDFDLF